MSPCEDSAQESHSTLVFAQGAKRIRNKVRAPGLRCSCGGLGLDGRVGGDGQPDTLRRFDYAARGQALHTCALLMPPACHLQRHASPHSRLQAVVNQDTVGDLRALQLENARLQRELAKKEVGGVGCLLASQQSFFALLC